MRIRGINPSQALLAIALLVALCWNLAYGAELRGVDVRSGPTGTSAELRLDARAEYKVIPLGNPDRLVVDLPGTRLRSGLTLPPGQGIFSMARTTSPATRGRSRTRPQTPTTSSGMRSGVHHRLSTTSRTTTSTAEPKIHSQSIGPDSRS